MENLWNYKGHRIKVVYGENRFAPVTVYLDGELYGNATYGKGLMPKWSMTLPLKKKR